MGKPAVVHFAEYRAYESARVQVNDACAALHLASRMAIRQLEPLASSEQRLTELLDVQEATYLDLTPAESIERLREAERHFAYMTIPYVVTVYEEFAKRLLLLRASHDGADQAAAEEIRKLPLSVINDELKTRLDLSLDPVCLELFELTRMMRNRIIHYLGTTGSNLRRDWNALSPAARTQWEKWTLRPAVFGRADSSLDLGVGEVVAVLAMCKRLAREACSQFVDCLPREAWADIVVSEVADAAAIRWGQRATRLRRVRGHALNHYSVLALTESELQAAIDRRGD